ncbi:EexN family lipoprotein [Bartonella sp. AU18XJBT]|uniref:EexN family lipoprotein n=1 Tax=Bartonella sp. AU18XJBT TaxID=3019089 RepID=UPI0031835248
MNKIIITTLLLCTGLLTAGCEKTYSVEEFKKNESLIREFQWKCGASDNSKNCQNVRQAAKELETEERKKADENYEKALEEINKR